MNLNDIKTKLNNIKEILIIVGSIITSILLGIWWLSDSMKDRERKFIEANTELINSITEKIKADLDPLTAADFRQAMQERDSMNQNMIDLATDHYINHLVRMDSLIIGIQSLEQSDRSINAEIKRINLLLRSVDKRTAGTDEHLRVTQLTDSLQNELFRLQMEQRTNQILREMENNHREELRKIKQARAPEYPTKVRKGRKGGIRMNTNERTVKPPL